MAAQCEDGRIAGVKNVCILNTYPAVCCLDSIVHCCSMHTGTNSAEQDIRVYSRDKVVV